MRQRGTRAPRVEGPFGRLQISRQFALGILLVATFAYGAESTVPEHATSAQFGSGWTCNSGYRKVGQACERILVPEHAYLTNRSYGDAWVCNRGYRRSRDTCIEIVLPNNAYLNSPRGDEWLCHRGYRKAETECILIPVPENAYLTNSTYGVGWKCERGFRHVNQLCEPVVIPEHAHLDMSGHDWRCNPPYRKRRGVCVAP